jgi:hypothetical protein
LDLSVYYVPKESEERPMPGHGYSELQILKRCLMRGKSIRKLRIMFENAGGAENTVKWEYGPLNFEWWDGEHLTKLEVIAT